MTIMFCNNYNNINNFINCTMGSKSHVFNFLKMEQFGGLSKYQVMVKPEPDIGYIQHSRQTWIPEINKSSYFELVYDRNHLFGLGSDTETETENWPKLLADTETNRNQKILNCKALYQGVCKNFSCNVNYQNIYSVHH